MNEYPKHYLADVPHDLRMRVLDLCIHRQWHDALDLLHQNGFTQYEWYEVVWFHDHAPTNLPPLECGGSTPLSLSIQPGSGPETADVNLNAEPRTGNPEPLSLTMGRNSVEPNLNSRNLNKTAKVPKPRSKIARLPQDLQLHLNAMLKDGRPYGEI